MALEAGSVYAILGGRFVPTGFAQFDAAMKRSAASAAAAESQVTKSSGRSSAAMAAMGRAAKTGAAAGLVAVGVAAVASVKSAQKFEKQMSELKAVTSASAKDFGVMRKAALDLGASTGIGATEAARALTELAKGGLSSKQAIGALTGTIAMAQAGGMDLADAGNTVANALNLFKLRGEDATMVADSFANAANATTADIGFFSQGLAQGGAAAKAAGLTFQETTVFLEAMAANGFKSGSDAGTSMKTALIQLANPTKRAQEAAAGLGVAFFDSNNQIRPLPAIARDLGNAFDDMSKKDKLATATRLVGTDGMRALLALADQGPNKLKAFASANGETGSAARVAAEKMNNYEGSLKRLSAAFESLKIEAGTALIPILTKAANGLAKFFGEVRTGEGTGGTVAKVIRDIGLAIGSLAGSAAAMSKLSQLLPDGFSEGAVRVLGVIRAMVVGLGQLASVGAKLPGPLQAAFKGAAVSARMALDDIDKVTGALRRGLSEKRTLKIIADTKQAKRAIEEIRNSQFKDAVQRILGNNKDAKTKVKEIVALGIPEKIAKILVKSGSAKQAIEDLRSQLASLRNRNIEITTTRREVIVPGRGRALGSQADGRAAGVAETALVGEGGGPEYVVNRRTGKSMRVDKPTVMSLGKDDYVIPTERRYADRANELLMGLARDLGIVGYKKGKAPARKPAAKPAAKAATPPGSANAAKKPQGGKPKTPKESPAQQKAREERRKILGKQGLAFSRHSLDWYDQEIAKEERYKDQKGKDKKLTARAKRARTRLDGLRKEKRKAQQYKAKIDKATGEADIALDQMREADTRDDQGAFDKAWRVRKDQLTKAITLITAAVGESSPSSTWNRELRAQLARLRGDDADLGAKPSPVMDAPDTGGGGDGGAGGGGEPPPETTFSGSEQARLAELEAGIALAALTEGTVDDRAALQAKLDFLTPILAAATATQGRGRGGFGAITEIANDLRGTRDNLQQLTDAANTPTADQQQLIDQARSQGLAQGQTAFIDRLAGATMQGAGQTLVFQSYVPPSPTEAKRLADYTVGGIGFQGQSPSSTERVGV